MSTSAKTRIVGSSVPRKEGVDKLMGAYRRMDRLAGLGCREREVLVLMD